MKANWLGGSRWGRVEGTALARLHIATWEAYGVLSDVTLSGVVQFLRIKAAVIRNDFHFLAFKCETFPYFDT